MTTLAACAALAAVLAAGCSSEQLALTLGVSAAPNPVTGADEAGGRRWEFQVSIANPNPVGVRVEYFHLEISDTDSGYAAPLTVVKDSDIVGRHVASGATITYPASRESDGNFSRATERRIYHALGDDGVYYSGEVVVELR